MSRITTVSARTLAAYARTAAIPYDIVEFLDDYATTEAELMAVSAFLKSAAALIALPQYQYMKTVKHCVRCHALFRDSTNGPRACTIPHVFARESGRHMRHGRGGRIIVYTSECCDGAVMLKEDAASTDDYLNLNELGKCFTGCHTTDVHVIQKSRFHKYNGSNIQKCKLNKKGECIKECVEHEPLFVANFE